MERYHRTGQIDRVYLRGLSADAVPALAAVGEPCPPGRRSELVGSDNGLLGFNFARRRAREILSDSTFRVCDLIW